MIAVKPLSHSNRDARPLLNWCLALVATLLATTQVSADDAYLASRLFTGDGKIIEDAVMLVADGKITAIGKQGELEIPAGTRLHSFPGATLVPGLVIAETDLADGGRDEDEALTPFIRAVDGFDYFSDYDSLLAAGITTVQLSPGSRRLMPGQGAVVKLAGNDPLAQTISEQESLRILLTQAAFDPPRLYEPPVGAVSVDRPLEPTRPQLAGNLGDAVAGLRALLLARGAVGADDDLVLSTLNETIGAGQTVRMTARTPAEILAAWQLADEFQLPVILVGIDGLGAVTDAVAWSGDLVRGVVLEAERGQDSLRDTPLPTADDVRPLKTWERVAELKAKGVLSKTAFVADGSQLTEIWFLAAQCKAAGLTTEEILQLLTANPAKMMAVDNRVGSLAAGKDADFVVLSTDPFATGSRVLQTYVDGMQVFDAPADEATMVVSAGRIYTADGILEDASVVVQGGKIRSVGSSVSAPRTAKLVDYPNAVIVPGFVDLDLRVGTGAALSERVGLNDKIGAWLARDDAAVSVARSGGITTGFLSSTNLPSPVVAFKLGDVPRVLADPVAIRYSISGNLTTQETQLRATLNAAKQYAETWAKYDQAYEEYKKKLAEYEQAKAKYDAELAERKKKEEEAKQKAEQEAAKEGEKPSSEGKPAEEKPPADKPAEAKPAAGETSGDKPATEKPAEGKTAEAKPEGADAPLVEPKKPDEPAKPRLTEALEPYRTLFAGKIKALVNVDSALATQLAIKLFVDEFKLPLVLVASGSAHREAALVAEKGVTVVLVPPMQTTEDGQAIQLAERFRTAGASVAIASSAGTGAKDLVTAVAYAVYRGLGEEDGLQAMTTVPAELMGFKQIGAIAPQHDADLVVMSGPPMAPGSRVLAVMIDGRWVYQSDEVEEEAR